MKNKKLYVTGIMLLVLCLTVTGCKKEIEVKNGSKVAVSVKGEKITATEYYQEIKEDNISKLVDLIDKGYLEEAYKTDDEETKDVQKQIDQIKNIYGTEGEELSTLIKNSFGVKTEKELRERLKLEYKRKKAVEDYVEDNLSDGEIKDYYKNNIYGEVRASHILIAIDAKEKSTEEEKEDAEEVALNKAKDLIKQLDEGEEFSKLAKKNSDDDATAVNGGDLGYFEVDDMTEEFANAIKSLKVKEYTKEPIKTEFGYHIILKTGEKEKPKLKKVKDKIKETLRKQKLDDNNVLFYETLMKVREKYKISWNDVVLESAYKDYMNDLIDKAKEDQNK